MRKHQQALQFALGYAGRGWAVLPLAPGAKTPIVSHGVHDATTDKNQIEEWFNVTADTPNIGLAAGEESGFFVIDVDPRNGGFESWDEYERYHTPIDTYKVSTSSGGFHLYIKWVPEAFNGKICDGVDVKSDGGYVVAPPSVHPNGDKYAKAGSPNTLAECPDWLRAELVGSRPAPSVYEALPVDPNDTRPGTVMNAQATWGDILGPHGWTQVGSDAKGTLWLRPGETDAKYSARAYADTDKLHVFSTGPHGLPTDGNLDKFRVYTELNYQGDFEEAAQNWARETWGTLDGLTMKRPSPIPPHPETVASEAYAFDMAADGFIAQYIEYARAKTDAPLEYHEAGALSLLALAASRSRGALAPFPEGLPTNLYLLLVGDSTRSRKSTSQAIAKQLAKTLWAGAVLPERATTEGLIVQLSDRPGMPSLWTPDEFGATLEQIGKREFLRGLEELILTLYSGSDYHYTRVSGDVDISEPHLQVLAAATPESLAAGGTNLVSGGLFPRFGIVYPSTLPPRRGAAADCDDADMQGELLTSLRRVMAFSQKNPRVTYDAQALEYLNAAEEEYEDLMKARLPTMLYKVAMLCALQKECNVVGLTEAAQAATIVGRWSVGSDNLKPWLRRNKEDQRLELRMQDALDMLPEHEGMLREDIAMELAVTRRLLNTIEETLVDRGLIAVQGQATERTWTRRG